MLWPKLHYPQATAAHLDHVERVRNETTRLNERGKAPSHPGHPHLVAGVCAQGPIRHVVTHSTSDTTARTQHSPRLQGLERQLVQTTQQAQAYRAKTDPAIPSRHARPLTPTASMQTCFHCTTQSSQHLCAPLVARAYSKFQRRAVSTCRVVPRLIHSHQGHSTRRRPREARLADKNPIARASLLPSQHHSQKQPLPPLPKPPCLSGPRWCAIGRRCRQSCQTHQKDPKSILARFAQIWPNYPCAANRRGTHSCGGQSLGMLGLAVLGVSVAAIVIVIAMASVGPRQPKRTKTSRVQQTRLPPIAEACSDPEVQRVVDKYGLHIQDSK